MKEFTVKEFIGYNNPCFSCGENIHFSFALKQDDMDGSTVLRPTVTIDNTTVDLKVSYRESLQLLIVHQTNKFIAYNSKELENFLKKTEVFLISKCNKCFTNVESDYLDFNFEKGFIKPVSLFREVVMMSDDSYRYHIRSNFSNSKSFVVIDRIDKVTPISPITFEAPILPMSKFKNKKQFMDKMKTYMVFS